MVHGKLRLVAWILLVAAVELASAQADDTSKPPGPWQPAPQYVRLFAPVGDRAGWYRAYVSPQALDDVLRQIIVDERFLRPPGAWMPTALLPLDAFGLTGRYDRNKLTRVYGARRARVARGPFGINGRPDQSWTLISPYPDPEFTYLQPGTLLLRLDLAGH